MVLFSAEGTGGLGAAGPAALDATGAAAPGPLGFVTRNECPHLGHLIFRPAGGTRRSSIWYGALHASHSTFSIGRQGAYHAAFAASLFSSGAGERHGRGLVAW